MPYYCTVPRCTSMAGKAKNVSFHQFPRDEELARLWNDILKRGKPYTKYSKVCSLHFRPEDYTITSVGKNKGQWRTLRKDAVPSRNLPSESPAPYSRKQWESWSQNSTPSVMDPSIHQHVAQAIYMQTMLAMQAAGNTETTQNGSLPLDMAPPTSSQEEIFNNKQPSKDSVSYKCEECTKCFKDPDVFILHQRSHSKDLKSNEIEKENFNMNLTLQSNPILANLLKTNSDNNFDPTIMAVESFLMTALAANMGYIKNLSMGKDRECDVNQDRDSNDRIDSNHETIESSRLHGDLNKDLANDSNYGDESHVRTSIDDKRVIRYTECVQITPNKPESPYFEDKYAESDLKQDDNSALGENNKQTLNHSNSGPNSDPSLRESELNLPISDPNLPNSDPPIGLSYAMNFSTKLAERAESPKYNGNIFSERLFTAEFKRDDNSETQNIENRSHCDNDLSESMDSNNLVIDENA